MTLENVSADHLRQVLEQIEEAAASERVMAAITYKESDDVTQEDAAELYGYSEGWASKWFNRLERLSSSRSRLLSTTNHVKADQRNSPTNSTNSSLKHSTTHLRKSDMTRPRGLFH